MFEIQVPGHWSTTQTMPCIWIGIRHPHQFEGARQLAYSGVKLFTKVCRDRRDRDLFKTALYRSLRAESG